MTLTFQEFVVISELDNMSLTEFLSLSMGISKGSAKKIIDSRTVFVNDKRVWMGKHRLRSADRVQVGLPTKKSSDSRPIGFRDVIYQDNDLVVLNKPPCLLSNGPKSAESQLQQMIPDQLVKAVHRLDRDTTGCNIFALSEEVWEAMYQLFREKKVRKIYHALVVGKIKERGFSIQSRIEGKEACSNVKLLKHLKANSSKINLSLIQVEIETGRTHQIRKHLQSVHYPIYGDRIYSSASSRKLHFPDAERQMLHAHQVAFIHPLTGKQLSVVAPYPTDFTNAINRLS